MRFFAIVAKFSKISLTQESIAGSEIELFIVLKLSFELVVKEVTPSQIEAPNKVKFILI